MKKTSFLSTAPKSTTVLQDNVFWECPLPNLTRKSLNRSLKKDYFNTIIDSRNSALKILFLEFCSDFVELYLWSLNLFSSLKKQINHEWNMYFSFLLFCFAFFDLHFNQPRFIHSLVVNVDIRCVIEICIAHSFFSKVLMNMSKNMHFWFQFLNEFKEPFAPSIDFKASFV